MLNWHDRSPSVCLAKWVPIGMRGLLMLWICALSVEHPVALSVFPRVDLRVPGQIRARLTVPRHPDNRAVCWAYDGPEYRSLCWTVDGRSPRTETVWWYLRHAGGYEALASVTRMEEGRSRQYVVRTSFQIGPEAVRAASAPRLFWAWHRLIQQA